MSFFGFNEILGVLKSGPYIRICNAIFFADFFPGRPAGKASNDAVHRHSSPSHHRFPMTDRGIEHDSFIHST